MAMRSAEQMLYLSSRLRRMSVMRGGILGMTQEFRLVQSCLMTAAVCHLPSAPCTQLS